MRKEQIISKRGYIVSEEGKAYNPKGEEIGKSCNGTGYKNFSIRINKKSTLIFIHRLQAFQKYGDGLYEDGIMARHLNGDSSDNSWNNIAIGTNSDNQMDIPKQIRIKRALHATSFARKHNKEEIKKFHLVDRSYKETMKKFNISSKGTLHFILNN